jgi:hypothetical protein
MQHREDARILMSGSPRFEGNWIPSVFFFDFSAEWLIALWTEALGARTRSEFRS